MTNEEFVRALRDRADKVASRDAYTASYLRQAADKLDERKGRKR